MTHRGGKKLSKSREAFSWKLLTIKVIRKYDKLLYCIILCACYNGSKSKEKGRGAL